MFSEICHLLHKVHMFVCHQLAAARFSSRRPPSVWTMMLHSATAKVIEHCSCQDLCLSMVRSASPSATLLWTLGIHVTGSFHLCGGCHLHRRCPRRRAATCEEGSGERIGHFFFAILRSTRSTGSGPWLGGCMYDGTAPCTLPNF